MTIPSVLSVTVDLFDACPRLLPVASLCLPSPEILHQACNDGFHWKKRESDVKQSLNIRLNECLRLHYREKSRGQHGFAVVADPCRFPGQIKCESRVARRDHRPRIDKDLGTDLFGNDLAVELYRPTSWRFNSML